MDLQLQNYQEHPQTKYCVRRSTRAKHAQVKIDLAGNVIIVVPHRFNVKRVPEIIAAQQPWIDVQVNRRRARFNPQYDSDIPVKIFLRAAEEHWALEYSDSNNQFNMNCELTGRSDVLRDKNKDGLPSEQLITWINKKAKQLLVAWGSEISEETGLHAARFSVRNQKTRWGSCSQKKTISLNRNLLFIPPQLVRYLIIHELCHTVHMNHSSKFWNLVESFEPDYLNLDKELSESSKYIPLWAAPGL